MGWAAYQTSVYYNLLRLLPNLRRQHLLRDVRELVRGIGLHRSAGEQLRSRCLDLDGLDGAVSAKPWASEDDGVAFLRRFLPLARELAPLRAHGKRHAELGTVDATLEVCRCVCGLDVDVKRRTRGFGGARLAHIKLRLLAAGARVRQRLWHGGRLACEQWVEWHEAAHVPVAAFVTRRHSLWEKNGHDPKQASKLPLD